MKQYIKDTFGLEPTFFTGTVEDRSDPLQMGRVRVRIHGYHTADKSLIPTEHLPWSIPIMPVTSAANSGVGESPTGLMIGTLVLGFWLDGNDMQMPAILGTINQLENGASGSGGNSSGSSMDGRTPLIDTQNNRINDQDPKTKIPSFDQPTGAGPRWLEVAKKEIGVKENTNSQYSAQIHKYLKTVGLAPDERIPWCSAFVAWCVKEGGGNISGANGRARSWLNVGQKLDTPKLGCIIVFNYNHVGIYTNTQGGRIGTISGNYSNSVRHGYDSPQKVIGMRWPG